MRRWGSFISGGNCNSPNRFNLGAQCVWIVEQWIFLGLSMCETYCVSVCVFVILYVNVLVCDWAGGRDTSAAVALYYRVYEMV